MSADGPRTRPWLVVVAVVLAVILAVTLWLSRTSGVISKNKLLEELKSKEPKQRATAIEGLADLGDPAAVEPLIAALKDEEWTVRRTAANALGKLKDGRAVPDLIDILKKDKVVWVQVAAARALGRIGDKSALDPIGKLVKSERAKPKDKQNSDIIMVGEQAIDEIKSK